MGALQMSRHQFGDALQWGEQGPALSPQNAYAYGVIGDAQTELGDYDQAIASLPAHDRTCAPTSVPMRVSRMPASCTVIFAVRRARPRWSSAATAGGPAPENVAWTHWQLGDLYFNSGQLAQAETGIQWSRSRRSRHYLHAQAGLARCAPRRAASAEAIDLDKQAVANVPLPQYVQELGDLYAATGDAADAKQQYDLVLYTFHVFEVNGVDVGIEKAAFLADQDSRPRGVQLAEPGGADRA